MLIVKYWSETYQLKIRPQDILARLKNKPL